MHRTLHLVVSSARAGLLAEEEAQDLVRGLVDSDARFPAAARENLFDWARSQHLF